MSIVFNEAAFENALVSFFQEKLGYDYLYGPEVERANEYHDCFLENYIHSFISRINPGIPDTAISDALFEIRNRLSGGLVQRNEQFHNYLKNCVEVSLVENGEKKNYRVKLIDFDDVEANSFIVCNQWSIKVNNQESKRPDVIVFVNGLPLVVFELKSFTNDNAEIEDAYNQLQNYMQVIPGLFDYNAFCVISNMINTKAGTITSDETRFVEWKTVDGVDIDNNPSYQVLVEGMFEKHRLLDIIKNFILFMKKDKGSIKILAAYHQYYAVRKALETTTSAIGGTKRGGVFWHTQGSGKSLSMLFLANLLRNRLDNPTIIVITDRNDLDGQLFRQFSNCASFLCTQPYQANSIADLTTKLQSTFYGGVIFTTMWKFERQDQPFSLRENIVVLVDEAHRSQYGLSEKFDRKRNRLIVGSARVVRDALPNATWVGFTGTPIAMQDKNTIEVFGNTIDVYDMTQSVADHSTCPVYYESRVMNLNLDDNILKQIDGLFEEANSDDFDEYYQYLSGNQKELPNNALRKTQKEMATIEAVFDTEKTLNLLANDIIAHYEMRQDILTGKAMIVAFSRPIAIKLYKKIIELRPNWVEKVKCVMTYDNNDPKEWGEIICHTKSQQKELEQEFKDDDSNMKIAIVVDMWLTGFDVPSLATMYIFKPMRSHNLMQAIARVNRVFKDKEGGLIVDYVGIAQALKEAMKQYTQRDRDSFGDNDISKTAYIQFKSALEICKGFFHGFDISPFIKGDDLDRGNTITKGLNLMFGKSQKVQDDYSDEAYKLRQASSLCRSMQTHDERFYGAFFEAIRMAIDKFQSKPSTGKSIKELKDQISALLNQSVHSKGVISLFGDKEVEFSIMDPAFMEEVANMKEKNIAAELLKKILNDKIRAYKKTNLVKAQKYSEAMTDVLNRWNNAQITNTKVIEELLRLANELANSGTKDSDGNPLTDDEQAFYDALTKPQAVKDFYENDQLVALTKELADTLRKNATIDWNKKESARADMRSLVRRLLKKYKYPPENTPDALKTVIEQCELWAENEAV